MPQTKIKGTPAMLTTRREVLVGASALGIAAAAPAIAQIGAGDAAASAYLQQIAEELLVDFPENALSLGVDKDARAALHSRFGDRGPAAYAARSKRASERLAKLKAIDRGALSPKVALDVDVTRTAHEIAVEGWRAMPVGDVAIFNNNVSYRSTPYVVSQNSGAYLELPDTLTSYHEIKGLPDAEAYVARIEAYAAAIDGETERLIADQAKGAILPASSTMSRSSSSPASTIRRPIISRSCRLSPRNAANSASPTATKPMRRCSMPSASHPRSHARLPRSNRCARRPATCPASGSGRAAKTITPGW
jgi:uncharacterized protein (DUF885 family)